MNGENRIGEVSSVDVETGMVSVIYHDKDETVTQMSLMLLLMMNISFRRLALKSLSCI